jgi:outer membrane receptor protein involved in Fe transport
MLQMNSTLFRKSVLAQAVTATALFTLGVTSANAQMLEEVVVTATKRAEGLQDVPIAISVMSGDAMTEKGLLNLEDVTTYMPNIHVAEGGAGTQLFIRGIGSGINYGFEQSVGTFIDGVYFGRGRSARSKFLDVARVEVLKGPQSTLFGKNTIAGAINITTNRPTDEFEAYIDGAYRTELEATDFTGMISGGITDNLRGRVVINKYDDSGYVENKAQGGRDAPKRDASSFRGILDWDATDDLNFFFKAEHHEFDVDGRQQMISKASDQAAAIYRGVGDPNFKSGFDYEQYDLGFPGQGLFDDTESNVAQLNIEWRFGDYTLKSITAYTDYEFSNALDSDYSPLIFLARARTEEHEQFTQEFLFSSATGGFVDFLGGVFYQDEELSNDRNTQVIFSNVPPIEAAILANPALAPFNIPTGGIDGIGYNTFQQDAQSWSVFAEFTFNFTDTLRLTAGARYSEDEKDVEKVGTLENVNELIPDPLLFTLWGPAALNLATEHAYEKSRDEDHTTGHINLQWDYSDFGMLYVNLANGYKAGGFDEDNSLGREFDPILGRDASTFEDEEVVAVEIGTKMTLMDGRGRLNMALFRSEYDDVQVSTFDGSAAFVVGNAAETEVDGFEADLEWAFTDNFYMNAAFAWLDATYESFEDAACNEDQFLAHIEATGSRSGCVQDLSGEPLQFAPEYTANIGFRYDTGITERLDLGLGLDYLWSDDVVVANDLDEHLIQDSYGKLNGQISLSSSSGSWTVALIGKNLTDEKTFTWGNDVPLASLGFSKTYFRHIDPPRTFELRARYNF